jgi:hypothetical protein
MKKNVDEQRGYNFKAVLSLEGLEAGMGWVSGDPTMFTMLFSVAQYGLEITAAPPTFFDSIPNWPALFIAKGTKDELLGPDGAVATYNQARGLKEIVLVRGEHTMGSWGDAGFMYVVRKLIKFAREAALRPATAALNNTGTTTLRKEICKAPPYESGILHSSEMLSANRIKQFLRDKCREDGGTWDEANLECYLP